MQAQVSASKFAADVVSPASLFFSYNLSSLSVFFSKIICGTIARHFNSSLSPQGSQFHSVYSGRLRSFFPATMVGNHETTNQNDAKGQEDDVVMHEGEEATALALPLAQGGEDDYPTQARASFAAYLASPIVTLLIGTKGNETLLSAHQALLVKSPFFRDRCDQINNEGGLRQLELPGEHMDSVGCFLEYLYTGDYFPKKVPGSRQLESDPSVPQVDETGDQLLKHARVYTLAEKFGMDKLKNLASSKIHCVNSTAKGEITYARYVYAYTGIDDFAIRAPVANFWATRSHTLRSEAELEFRSLCLEFPQFGYDVLSKPPQCPNHRDDSPDQLKRLPARVLDEKVKREKQERIQPASGSARKRPRHSHA